MGVVCRDISGKWIEGACANLVSNDVIIIELLTIREDLIWIKRRGWNEYMILSDFVIGVRG